MTLDQAHKAITKRGFELEAEYESSRDYAHRDGRRASVSLSHCKKLGYQTHIFTARE